MNRAGRRLHRSAAVAALLVAALLLFAVCGDDDAPATESTLTPTATLTPAKLTFLAGFRPQANLPFVGVYVAQEKGFFAQEALEVSIEHEAGTGNFPLVAQNRVQITTGDASVVLQRRADPGLPIVVVALIGQEGQQGWVSLKDSGINRPADWAGKRVGYRSTLPADFAAIMEANGVDPRSVRTTNIGFQPPQLLIEGIVDVYPVFLSNEPDTIRRKLGRDVNTFKASDYGVPTLGLTYLSSESYVKEHRDVVARFLRAALRGVEYARDNREEAVEIVLKYAPQEEREHQRFMLDTELAAAQAGAAREGGIGWMTRDQWQRLYDTLRKHGALPKEIPDIGVVFDRSPLEMARMKR